MKANDVIPRVESQLEPNTFRKAYFLCKNHDWLESEMDAFLSLWNICDNENQKKLVENLIKRFTHIDSKELKEIGKKIANHIVNEWQIKSAYTKVIAICSDKEPDGSQAILQNIKNKFVEYDWKKTNFFNNLLEAIKKIRNGDTIILIDDFIGTGNTIEDKIKYVKEELKKNKKEQYSLYLVSVAAMEFAKEKLNTLEIDYYSCLWLKKGISDYSFDEQYDVDCKAMKSLEDKLGKRWNGKYLYRFGYGKSEALFAIEPNNVPNNVFPIFWWPVYLDSSKRKTIFKRLL